MHRRCFAAGSLVLAAAINAQPAPPDYGFDFVTIGDVENSAYDGFDGGGRIAGRGAVNYEYRMARTELRTSQFLEFMNVLGELAPQTALNSIPSGWGAITQFNPDNTVRFELDSSLPNAGDIGVYGISWRLAATYANWLHNDKERSLDALNSGAYDRSTFFTDPDSPPNLLDQTTRSPDARYWIPSLDEWLKAAHYDPNKNGEGEGGWWQYPNGTDGPLQAGLPGEAGAETSYQLDLPNFNELTIPIGAYPETQSPWGLLDVSGGAPEWTETWLDFSPQITQLDRFWMGSLAGPNPFINIDVNQDVIWQFGASDPRTPAGRIGLRIASVIPSPGSAVLLGMVVAAGGIRRRSRPGSTLRP